MLFWNQYIFWWCEPTYKIHKHTYIYVCTWHMLNIELAQKFVWVFVPYYGKTWTNKCLANRISLQNLKSSLFFFLRIISTCPSVFIAGLFTIFKRWKQPNCPSIDKQINKTWYLPYDGELFSPKQEGNPNTCLQHPVYNKT